MLVRNVIWLLPYYMHFVDIEYMRNEVLIQAFEFNRIFIKSIEMQLWYLLYNISSILKICY